MRKIIIDTDPGVDDAVAIAALLSRTDFEIRLITTVAGNVSVDKTTANVAKLLDFFHCDIPLAAGAAKPLVRQLRVGARIHGESGMEGYPFPMPKTEPIPMHAVEAIHSLLLSLEEPITILALGPLTNLALLLSVYPSCMDRIERIVIMGGSSARGNESPAAEFNMLTDPESAKIVFSSGVPLSVCGLDVTNRALLNREDVDCIAGFGETGSMIVSLLRHYRGGNLETGIKIHDACAAAYLTNPEMFRTEETFVDVELSGVYTAGYTVVDLKHKLGHASNARFCTDIDVEAFKKWLMKSLRDAEVSR